MIENRMARRGQGGFTLIELLVVIAILAVLAGAAIVGIGAMRENAKKTACKSDMDTIQTAAEAYSIDLDTTAVTKASLLGSKYLKKLSDGDFNVTYNTTSKEFVATPITSTGSKYAGVEGC